MSNSAQRDAKDTRDESSRAGDTDRIQLAQLLAYAAEQGRLQLKDYEDRLTRAYAATTYAELDQLRNDLPGAPINPRRGGKPNPAPSTLLLALLSGFERRGRWNVPKKLTTFTLWGSGWWICATPTSPRPRSTSTRCRSWGDKDFAAARSQRRDSRPRRHGQLRPQRLGQGTPGRRR